MGESPERKHPSREKPVAETGQTDAQPSEAVELELGALEATLPPVPKRARDDETETETDEGDGP